jgi:hypothetical protein
VTAAGDVAAPAWRDERSGQTARGGARRWHGHSGRLVDLAVALGYVLGAVAVYQRLWAELDRAYLSHSMQDQNMWEWFFAVTAHAVSNLDNPLFSDLQNHPDGVNLMANTAMLGLGIPLTPVTLAFGPTVTWALALTGGMAGTAVAWYWVMSRHLVGSRAGAAVGGAFCAFAPPIVSHGNAHPNFVALFVLPFITLFLLKLARGARPVRDGVVLGLLLTLQIFLGEEPLLIGTTAFLAFGVVYALSRPLEVAPMLKPLGIGLAVAAAVSVALVAFPLWWQFSGPQSYESLEHGLVGNDVAAFSTFATESLAGDPERAAELSLNRTEENSFFGWPLVLLMIVVTAWLWREAAARAVAVAMFFMAWVSTGVLLLVDGESTALPGPWLTMFDLPLFESVLESRFSLGCVPLIGLLLAFGTRKVLRSGAPVEWRVLWRVVWFSALTVALLPIAPTSLPVIDRGPTPAFFAEGTWREHVDPGGAVVMAPLPDPGDAQALHWQIETGLEFPLAEGYFVGPAEDGQGIYGTERRPTSELLDEVAEDGEVPAIDDEDRVAAIEDLRFWRADVVVLGPHRHEEELRETVDLLLARPGRQVDGVWVWDVRMITS